VAPCPSDSPLIAAFETKYRAKHVTPPRWRDRNKPKMVASMASDFKFLALAPTLVLGEKELVNRVRKS
jgi:hypothetical protein